MEEKKEFELISYSEFKIYCDTEICLRKTSKSKNCLKEYKREKCYRRYCDSLEKKWKKIQVKISDDVFFRAKIIERDKTCRVWVIFTDEEKKYILKNFYDEYILKSDKLEVAHAISRTRAPELIFEETNVFLVSKYFHSLLDTYKDLITQRVMSNEEREVWINLIMRSNNIWKEEN